MTIFNKPLTDPELLAVLKKEGNVVLEVTVKRYYVLNPGDLPLDLLMQEWFVKFKTRGHAFRDSSHVGGGDEVIAVKDLTNNKPVELLPLCSRCAGKGWVLRPNPAACISSEWDATMPCPECKPCDATSEQPF